MLHECHIQFACVLCGCLIEMEFYNQCPVCKVFNGTGRDEKDNKERDKWARKTNKRE